MKNWIKNKAFSLIILSILILIFIKFREYENGVGFYSYLFLILAIQPAIDILPDWKVFKPLKLILGTIVGIILLIGPIYKSLVYIFFAFLIPTMLIALIFTYFPEFLFEIDLTYSSKVYFVLILSTLFITFCIKGILIRINNYVNYNKSNAEKESQLELTLSLANKKRIRFVIYFFFFCYLIIFSFAKLNEVSLFQIPNVDLSIFYSFVTYIALDRVSSNLELMDFNPRNFFSKAVKSWESLNYFDVINKEKDKRQ